MNKDDEWMNEWPCMRYHHNLQQQTGSVIKCTESTHTYIHTYIHTHTHTQWQEGEGEVDEMRWYGDTIWWYGDLIAECSKPKCLWVCECLCVDWRWQEEKEEEEEEGDEKQKDGRGGGRGWGGVVLLECWY